MNDKMCIRDRSIRRDMALAQGAIALYLNRWLESKFELPKAELPDLSRERSPEEAASAMRQVWGLGELPIRNVAVSYTHLDVYKRQAPYR